MYHVSVGFEPEAKVVGLEEKEINTHQILVEPIENIESKG